MSPPLDPQRPNAPDGTRSFEGRPKSVDSHQETRGQPHIPAASTDAGLSTPTPLLTPLPEKYEFRRFLGRGGMGEVLHVFDTDLQRDVALKFMRRQAATSPQLCWRFLEEARILAQLKHRSVVKVYERGEIDGRPYFAMDYLSGATLSERRTEFRTSAAVAVAVIVEVAAGVQHAHEHDIYHRDLKASNIVFDGSWPVVTDFGCAKWDEGELSTQGVALFGTPSHMAPEVWEHGSKEHDARADLWSLGVMLYQLLAGELPFPDDPRTPEGRKELLERDPTPIRRCDKVAPGVDERLERVVLKALAKNPDDRHPTVAAFAAELEEWLAEAPPAGAPVSRPVTPPKSKPRWQWLVAMCVAVVAVLGVGATVLWPKTEKQPSVGERLAADEEVKLIGAKGMPLYPAQRAAGFTEGTLEVNSDGLCEVSAARVAMFDLADEPLPLPVRFSVEVSHAVENPGSMVGIYAGRKTHPQANGKGVCHAAAVNWFTASPFPPPNAAKDGTASFALYWVAPADPSSLFFTPCTYPAPLKVPRQPLPPPDGEPQFRTLTIDLYPTTTAATHDGTAVVNPINLPLSLAVMREMVDMRGETRNTPVYPGNGFGLIVIQGSAVVRNATLRRIPQ